MKKPIGGILLGVILSLAAAPVQSRSVESPSIDPAAVNAARQQLTMTAHVPVPGAGVMIFKYPPGWVPEVKEGSIAIKSPDGFSTFEIAYANLPGFMQSPDEVVQRVILPFARRETPDLQVLDARTTTGLTGPAREYVNVGTKQGRRFFSHLTLEIIASQPPMPGPGSAGSTLIHWVLLAGIPEDQPQPRLNLMHAMALSTSEVLAGGGVQTPPDSGTGGSGRGSTRPDNTGEITQRCDNEAWTKDNEIYKKRDGGYGVPSEARRRERLYKECLERYRRWGR